MIYLFSKHDVNLKLVCFYRHIKMMDILKGSVSRSLIVICCVKENLKTNYLAKRLTIKYSKKCARNFELFMILLCYHLQNSFNGIA